MAGENVVNERVRSLPAMREFLVSLTHMSG